MKIGHFCTNIKTLQAIIFMQKNAFSHKLRFDMYGPDCLVVRPIISISTINWFGFDQLVSLKSKNVKGKRKNCGFGPTVAGLRLWPKLFYCFFEIVVT